MKRLTLLISALALAVSGTAFAQDKYPSKPVKIIVPYAPGGATDITARLYGEQLRQILTEQFVVESKPGAFGILAIEEMARAKPDGYTLMIGNVSTNAITPILYRKKFSIDFEREVVSVSRLAIYPSFLVTTTANFDVKTVAELIAYAKNNPGKLRYTSAGIVVKTGIARTSLYRHLPPQPREPVTASDQAHPRCGDHETTEERRAHELAQYRARRGLRT